MRETSPLMRPLSFDKQNPVYTKLVLLFLLLGVTIFLFSSRSINSSPPSMQIRTSLAFDSQETHILLTSESSDDGVETKTSPEIIDSEVAETDLLISDEVTEPASPTTPDSNKQKCDLFKGDWVPNPSGPAYNNYTCPMIEGHLNCLKNGRPDAAFLFWRWKPNDCELDKFNPLKFLEFMKYKRLGFVGDSISRNHAESMLCILSQVEEPKEVYHDEEWHFRVWLFPSYNFTITTLWSPFLLKAETFEDSNGNSTDDIRLHIDKLDKIWTEQYKNFDYVIISDGQWYWKTTIYYENDTIQGCHSCPKKNLTDIPPITVYGKALSLTFDFITSSPHKPRVLFRTISPTHFENGEWYNGGGCRRRVPFKENEVNVNYLDKLLYDTQVQEYEKAINKRPENGNNFKLLDTTKLSQLRPDGHPDAYRFYQPFANDSNAKVQTDCLHWCLPGPIDTWNDLLMESLINS